MENNKTLLQEITISLTQNQAIYLEYILTTNRRKTTYLTLSQEKNITISDEIILKIAKGIRNNQEPIE